MSRSPEEFSSWDKFEPREYLHEYYRSPDTSQTKQLEFLVRTFKSNRKFDLMLEFGGGPCIYPLIAAAPRVSEIHFADLLEKNLQEVHNWVNKRPGAWDWSRFTQKILGIERGCENIKAEHIYEREDAVREKISQILSCDAKLEHPITIESAGKYDLLSVNYVSESATWRLDEWHLMMQNIVSLLKPGGQLVMAALRGARRYSVDSKYFPAVAITERDIIRKLIDCGFIKESILFSVAPSDRGRTYPGVVYLRARKGEK